jgi:hypothetical protein
MMRKNNQELDEELQTWRDLLGNAVSKPAERHKLAATLRINAITITRWVAGTSNPRIETLRALLVALPEYRERMAVLLRQEYPGLFADEPVVDMPLVIPADFYNHVLNTYSMHPERLRSPKLISCILQQILCQLDPSHELDIGAFIAQCVPPEPGQKVRSLRIVTGYGGPPATKSFINQTFFCGAESQAGLAALEAHPVVIQNAEEAQRVVPNQHTVVFGSSLAIPILQYDRIAGCACFVSPQQDYFSPECIGLLKHYVNILTIAFEPHEFYLLPDVNLAMMPPRSQQAPILANLQERITAYMLHRTPEGLFLSWLEAEYKAIKEKEGTLLQLALNAVAPA